MLHGTRVLLIQTLYGCLSSLLFSRRYWLISTLHTRVNKTSLVCTSCAACLDSMWDVREACIGINLIREFFLSLVNFPLEEHKQLLTWQTCVYILRYFYNEGASFLLLPVLWICCRSCNCDIESGKVCNYGMNKQFQFERI